MFIQILSSEFVEYTLLKFSNLSLKHLVLHGIYLRISEKYELSSSHIPRFYQLDDSVLLSIDTIQRFHFNRDRIHNIGKRYVISYAAFDSFNVIELAETKEILKRHELIVRRLNSTFVKISVKSDFKVFIQIVWSYSHYDMRDTLIIDLFQV